jgi:hemin uptake protein HemP
MGRSAGQIRASLKIMANTLIHFSGKEPVAQTVPASSDKKTRIESNRLFQGASEIVIVHQNEEYNLRITRNGKLILTK